MKIAAKSSREEESINRERQTRTKLNDLTSILSPILCLAHRNHPIQINKYKIIKNQIQQQLAFSFGLYGHIPPKFHFLLQLFSLNFHLPELLKLERTPVGSQFGQLAPYICRVGPWLRDLWQLFQKGKRVKLPCLVIQVPYKTGSQK